MLAHDVAFGGNHLAIRVDPRTHRPIGLRCQQRCSDCARSGPSRRLRRAWCAPKAIEGPGHRHSGCLLSSPGIRDGRDGAALASSRKGLDQGIRVQVRSSRPPGGAAELLSVLATPSMGALRRRAMLNRLDALRYDSKVDHRKLKSNLLDTMRLDRSNG